MSELDSRHVQLPPGANCFECDAPAEHMHHVVPFAKGGRRALPLCAGCHGKAHGFEYGDHVANTSAALSAARARGVKLGAPGMVERIVRTVGADGKVKRTRVVDPERLAVVREIQSMHGRGIALRAIVDDLNARGVPAAKGGRWHVRTVRVALGLAVASARAEAP